jgi:DUF971 family protein
VTQRHPVEIAVTPERALAVAWDDGHTSEIPIDVLRDFCACATCRKARTDRAEAAETAPADHARPKRRSLAVLGAATRFELAGLEHVGRYGLGANWKDGHRSIFTYEYLAAICPCEACAVERGGPPVPFDPVPAG